MPRLRIYRGFISHAWKYEEDYKTVAGWLRGASNLRFTNTSVPKHDPLDGGSRAKLERELKRQIDPAQIVLVIAGMYVAHSRTGWIEFEIEEAFAMGKPIVGIRKWGAERIPALVQERAIEIVGWQQASVVDAVRRHSM